MADLVLRLDEAEYDASVHLERLLQIEEREQALVHSCDCCRAKLERLKEEKSSDKRPRT